MAKRLSYFLFVCLTFLCTTVFGQVANTQQNTETGAINEFFRSDNKIYVAVGLLVIIFTIIILYLVRLDRRLSKLEKE